MLLPVCGRRVPRNWSLTLPKNKQTNKQKDKKSVSTTKCPMPGSSLREINVKLTGRDPSPLCVNCLCTCHFSLWVFMTQFFAGARGSVSEGVVIEILGVFVFFQDFVFKWNRCLSDFETSIIMNRNIGLWFWSGRRKGIPSLAGAPHWGMEEGKCGLSNGVSQIFKEDNFLLVILMMILSYYNRYND